MGEGGGGGEGDGGREEEKEEEEEGMGVQGVEEASPAAGFSLQPQEVSRGICRTDGRAWAQWLGT